MYKIYFSDILSYGYVTITWTSKTGKTNLPGTKFKFRLIAEIYCYILTKGEKGFKTFRVVKDYSKE